MTSLDSYGAYFDISLIPNAQHLGFIIHNISTGVKDPGPNMFLTVATNTQAWAISQECRLRLPRCQPQRRSSIVC